MRSVRITSSLRRLALLTAVLLTAALPTRSQPPSSDQEAIFANHAFFLKGHILDTKKGLHMSPETQTYQLQWKGLTLRLEQVEAAPENPETSFAQGLERGIMAMRDKLEVELPETLDADLQASLDAHRRVGGLGVHGPLAFEGRLEAKYAWQGWYHAVVYRLTVTSLEGPKGSYQAR